MNGLMVVDDEEGVRRSLKRVLEKPANIERDLTLANTLAHRKAKKLLAQVDEFF